MGKTIQSGTARTVREALDDTRAALATARAEIRGLSMALTDAREEIERLRADATDVRDLKNLVRTMITTDPDDLISDGGHTMLDLWRHQAAQVLKGEPHILTDESKAQELRGKSYLVVSPGDHTLLNIEYQGVCIYKDFLVPKDQSIVKVIETPKGRESK